MKNKRIILMLLPLISSLLSGCSSRGGQFIGAGTKDNPYLITNKLDLIKFNSIFLNETKEYSKSHFKLTKDINFGNSTWAPVGDVQQPFSGSFDGGGHTVSNLKVNTLNSSGFFGYLGKGAYVHDLNVKYALADNYLYGMYYGGIAGYTETETKIINCSFEGSVGCTPNSVVLGTDIDSSFYMIQFFSTSIMFRNHPKAVGGIVGLNAGEVTNCRVKATISGGICGGIAGENDGTISNCDASECTINSTYASGSLVGLLANRYDQKTSISNCVARDIQVNSNVFNGGLVGASYRDVEINNNLVYGTHVSSDYTVSYSFRSILGDLIGGVLYKEGLSTEEVAANKANSVNDNHLNIHHNLVCFDHRFEGRARLLAINTPYLEEGSTLTVEHNISIMRIKHCFGTDIFKVNRYFKEGYQFYRSDDSNISLSAATSSSTLNKSIVAETLEKDENLIQEVDINGFTGYKY